jgi:ABC-type glutathione transport system ATPase component
MMRFVAALRPSFRQESERRQLSLSWREGALVCYVLANMPKPLLARDRNSEIFRRSGGAVVNAGREVSLAIHPGETLALVGESDSGKSALRSHRARPLAAGCRSRSPKGRPLDGMSGAELRRERVAEQPVSRMPEPSPSTD